MLRPITFCFSLTASVVLLSLAACTQDKQSTKTEGPLVRIVNVQPASATEREFTGVVAARVQSNLGFRVGGKVIKRLVDIGQSVKAGQPLMRLDRVDFEHAITAQVGNVAAAKARLIQSAADEVRYRNLASSGAASKSTYDQAKAAADSARALLDSAQAQLKVAQDEASYSDLLADANGIVVETLVEPGQVVAAGQVVVRLAHGGPREASIDLPETVRPVIGSTAQASLYGDNAKFAARLRQLSDSADPLTRTYEARYILSGAGAQAPIGATVTVYLPTGAPATSVSIPLSALDDEGNGPGVWILDVKKSLVYFQPVQIAKIGKETAILSGGLTVGQQVVALGGHLLHQGELVRVGQSTAAVQ